MSISYLLDTVAANLVALRHPKALVKLSFAEQYYVTDIVLGELYYGAYWYAYIHNSTKFLDMCDQFVHGIGPTILFCDIETAQIYGAIYAELRSKGVPIQQNDVWIAALARQYHLTVATVDSDLTRTAGIDVELW